MLGTVLVIPGNFYPSRHFLTMKNDRTGAGVLGFLLALATAGSVRADAASAPATDGNVLEGRLTRLTGALRENEGQLHVVAGNDPVYVAYAFLNSAPSFRNNVGGWINRVGGWPNVGTFYNTGIHFLNNVSGFRNSYSGWPNRVAGWLNGGGFHNGGGFRNGGAFANGGGGFRNSGGFANGGGGFRNGGGGFRNSGGGGFYNR